MFSANSLVRKQAPSRIARHQHLNDLVWDVTVVSTTAESYVAAAARGRREVAEMAATRKCQKYSELFMAYLFLPIAVETLGPMNGLAYEFFEILGHKITDLSGDSQEVSFLFQRPSVIIQRFNAALFCDTFTLHDHPDLWPFQLLLPALFLLF